MTPLPTISVIIPTYRRPERIPPLVDAYLAQGADEIVVVLDGPHHGWQGILGPAAMDERVRVVELSVNGGLALARIAGLNAAANEVTILTDDDVVPGPEFVARHRQFHAAGDDRVLLGYMPVDLPARRGRDDAATYLYARDYEKQVAHWREADSDFLLASLWGGNVSLPRELYVRAEDYKGSQRLNYNEDLDLGIRLSRIGATAAFDPQAQALHQHRRDFAGFVAECVVRGEAVADLEQRWGFLPGQLVPLIRIPSDYRRPAAWVQRHIGGRDSAGALEGMLRFAYRSAGVLRVWRAQDAIARLVRRGLAIRGYRIREAEHSST